MSEPTPDELSLLDALLEGMEAGRQGLSASLNPWQDGTDHHKEWLRGFKGGLMYRYRHMEAA